MISKPDTFLFDEPLSNLDAELRVQMRGEISEMQRSLSTTTDYVTHDQIEAMTMGDRIAVIDKGRIMQAGAPTELYERPANTFVAGFIGSPEMNLLAAEELLSEADPTAVPTGGRSGTLGVRPGHLMINSETDTIRIGEARVVRIEDLGHETHLHLTTCRGESLTARAGGETRHTVAPGANVSLSVRAETLHAFDATTGERLS